MNKETLLEELESYYEDGVKLYRGVRLEAPEGGFDVIYWYDSINQGVEYYCTINDAVEAFTRHLEAMKDMGLLAQGFNVKY